MNQTKHKVRGQIPFRDWNSLDVRGALRIKERLSFNLNLKHRHLSKITLVSLPPKIFAIL